MEKRASRLRTRISPKVLGKKVLVSFEPAFGLWLGQQILNVNL